jgi:hypothetical protein
LSSPLHLPSLSLRRRPSCPCRLRYSVPMANCKSWQVSHRFHQTAGLASRPSRRALLTQLSAETGIPLGATPVAAPGNATLVIDCAQTTDQPVDKLGEPKAYRLEVPSTQARLTSATILTAMRGLQTFLQLVVIGPEGFVAQSVVIDDNPRFPWRGFLIDVTSHFMPVPSFSARSIPWKPSNSTSSVGISPMTTASASKARSFQSSPAWH